MDFQGHELLLLSKSVLPTMAIISQPKIQWEYSYLKSQWSIWKKFWNSIFSQKVFFFLTSKIRQSWQHCSKLQGQSSWVKVLMQSNLLLGLDLVNKYWKINYGVAWPRLMTSKKINISAAKDEFSKNRNNKGCRSFRAEIIQKIVIFI